MAIEQIRIKNAGGSYTTASLGAETNDIKISQTNPTNLTTTLNNLSNSVANKVDKNGTDSLMTQEEHNKIANLDSTYAPINHTSSSNTYGVATNLQYGHVKITDNLPSKIFTGSSDIALSQEAGHLLRSNCLPDSNNDSAHNSIYRGVDLLSNDHYGRFGNSKLRNLYNDIHQGNFDDIYVGDYFETQNGFEGIGTIKWYIAGINCEGSLFTTQYQHFHVTLIPNYYIKKIPKSRTDYKGYIMSDEYSYIMQTLNATPQVWETTFDFPLSDFYSARDKFSRYSNDTSTSEYLDYYMCPLTEAEILGNIFYKYDFNDYGRYNRSQLPIFTYNPRFYWHTMDSNNGSYPILTRPDEMDEYAFGSQRLIIDRGTVGVKPIDIINYYNLIPKVILAPKDIS